MRALRRFSSHWQNWLGVAVVAVFVFIAVAAPVLSPNDPKNPGPIKVVGRTIDHQPHPPSQTAPLGTLSGQVSVYHMLVWGTRSALIFGLATAIFTAIFGILIGTTSAYFGGFFNDLMMRITDAFLAFPLIAGVVFIQQMLSITLTNAGLYIIGGGMNQFVVIPEGVSPWITFLLRVDPVMIAFILFSWTSYARIMNTAVLTIMQTEYIQAVRALGAGHLAVIFRHLIPNAIAPMIILAARDVGGMVLLQATFTFIGLGGNSQWGTLLVRGRDWIIGPGGDILAYWWLFVPATLALMLFGMGWNLVGDLLNEVLDPRVR
jgi:peptide/nickel transport system permease protein